MEADLVKANDRKRSLHENHEFLANPDSFSAANIGLNDSFIEVNEPRTSSAGTIEAGKDAAQIFSETRSAIKKKGPIQLDEGHTEENIDSFDANETNDVSLTIGIPPVSQSRKKLIVLDLNGILADIVYAPPNDYTPDAYIAGRAIFKRPYCDDFLKFCCESFEVGIWSSRHRKNVEKFIDYLMGDMKCKLLFCWDASDCTATRFNTPGHRNKPLVFKDLRKLWQKNDPDLPWEKGYYNESNTLLIDDSPYKALLNPPHTAIFPHSFKFNMNDNILGEAGDLKVYLERLASADNVPNFVEQNPFGQIAITERSQDWGFYSQVIDSCLRSELRNEKMASETAARPATPSAQVVGNAFVEQYYHILYNSPDLAHRFYHDSSVISRPDSNGVMTSVTTMQGINEKILSFDYTNHKAEINTADAQKSYMEGVTVLVTGCLTGKDNLKREFVQSFFLAPQDNGYFVLNDVFRYVGDGEPLEKHKVNGVNNAPRVPPTLEPEPTQVPDPPAPDPATAPVEENQNVAEQVHKPSDPEKPLFNEKMPAVESHSHSNGDDIPAVVESASPSAQEDSAKKSYASIVKVAKGSPGPTRVYVPSNTTDVTPKRTEKQPPISVAPAPPEASAPSSVDAPESNDIPDEVEGHSVYIRNLPFNVTSARLEQEFKKFGPIKQGGVQVRNNKQQGYCFGFVEFVSESSMNDAIQASPITIGERQAFVEIKRTSTRVVNGRGSFPSRRGMFRNDSFRGRNFSGNRSFGRNEYGNRVEFAGRPRGGLAGHDGRGRSNHSSRPDQNSGST